MRVSAAALLAGAIGGLVAADTAQARRPATSWAGMLTCRISGGGSFILGSSRALSCRYKPSHGRSERYRGRINSIGLDLGVTKSAVLAWQVFAPGSGGKDPGRISGTYVGQSAQVAVGAGVGYNALVGLNQIVLNPVSVTGVSGVNAAAGVSSLRLTYAGR